MDIHVTSQVLSAMGAAARAAHPREACGILLGHNEDGRERITAFTEAANVHRSPEAHFEIHPQALIDAYRTERSGGPRVLGYFHSHPTGDPRPSATDAAMSAGDGKIWAIAAGGDLRFWRDDPDRFYALSYAVIGR